MQIKSVRFKEMKKIDKRLKVECKRVEVEMIKCTMQRHQAKNKNQHQATSLQKENCKKTRKGTLS